MHYTIGQFAGLHQVSKKTLRYYKDIGLLEPAGIDPINGYAFYEDEQCERMRRIQYLRRLRFTLEEIRILLHTDPESWISPVQVRLAVVRSEGRLLRGIEHELLALQKRIYEGKELYKTMAITTEYKVDTFELKEPLFLIGRAARVPYNKYEEKQLMIDNLISYFFSHDEPGIINNRSTPAVGFGLVCECEKDMSMGTYMMGIQVTCLDEIPEGMRSFIIPAGLYARVTFQASDRETLTNSALEGAYNHLYNKWLPQSTYIIPEILTAEVYIEDHMEVPVNPEMELWQLIKHK
jgi:DNA-binding transcriptional MerR regulator/predicted transcriptional regulator YdeE